MEDPVLADHSAPLAAPTGLSAVACPTSAVCLAVGDNGTVVTIRGTSRTVVSGVDAGAPLAGIACPAANLCVVQESSRLLVCTDPTAAHPTWTRSAPAPKLAQFGAITCASVSLCLAWSDSTTVEVSSAPAGKASTWTAEVVGSPQPAGGVVSAACAPVS